MATVSATWNQTNGNWFVDANWNEPNGVGVDHYIPGANNDVHVTGSPTSPAYVISYAGASTIYSLASTGYATLNMTSGSLELLNQSNFYQINAAAGTSLSIDSGSLTLNNANIAGTVSGDTLHFTDGTFNINSGADIDVTTWTIDVASKASSAPAVTFNTDLTYDGTFSLQRSSSYQSLINLLGHTLELTGSATLGGYISSGTLKLSGTGLINQSFTAEGLKIEIAGTTTATSGLTLSGSSRLLIDAGGTLNTAGVAYDYFDFAYTSVIDNNGTLNLTSTNNANIFHQYNSTGTTNIGSGGLTLRGGSSSLGGTFIGSGTLALDTNSRNVRSFSIASDFDPNTGGWSIGANSTAEEINVSFNGDVDYTGKFLLHGIIDLNGHTLTVTNTSSTNDLLGTIHDGGSFVFSGPGNIHDTLTIADSTTFENKGSITQWITGGLVLGSKNGDTATFINDTGATYTLRSGAGAGITDGSWSKTSPGTTQVINKGTIVVADEGGSSGVNPEIINEGTITIATDALFGLGGGSSHFGGTVSGSGTLSMTGSYTLGSDLKISTTNWNINTRYNIPTDGITLGGDLTYAGNFTSAATINLEEHTFTLTGNAQLSGTIKGSGSLFLGGTGKIGDLELTQHASLTINGTYAATGELTFGESGTLILTAAAGYGGVIDDFRSDDKIEIDGFLASSASFNNGVYTLSNGSTQVSLNFGDDLTGSDLSFYTDANGDTIVLTTQAPCYCPGTMIATDDGEVAVENLAIGDHVLTVSGRMRAIKWIGHRSYGGRFITGRKDILPICIEAGALGDNAPVRDLWVSPHHALYLDGVLIEAKDLLNDVTIYQADVAEEVSYFHIELDSHDVILADDAWAESFINADNRGMFHNARQYSDLYGEENRDMAARYYAPRLDCGDQLEAIRASIHAKSSGRKFAA